MISGNKLGAASRSTTTIDYKALFNLSPNLYMLISRDLRFIDLNEAYLRILGRSREDLVGSLIFEAFSPANSPDEPLRASLERVLTDRVPDSLPLIRYPTPHITSAGVATQDRYWSAIHVPLLDENGEVTMILQHAVDVTEFEELRLAYSGPGDGSKNIAHLKDNPDALARLQLKQGFLRRVKRVQETNRSLEKERRQWRRLFEQAPGFVCILRGPEHIFEVANRALRQLVGRETIGKRFRDALPELAGQDFFELLDRVYSSGETYVGHAMPVALQRNPEDALETLYVDFVYQPIFEPNGNVSGIFVQGHDVTGSRQLEAELSYQASHDDLTGLVNRREFERRLTLAIADAAPNKTEHALLYLDLDQFKVVNDTCGHAAGDELLRHISGLLLEHMRDHPGATLGRLGGDEFGVLLTDCSGEVAERIAEEQRELVAETEFCWEGHRFGQGISIGVITFDGTVFTLKEVLSTADSACFMAKEKGRNRVHVYHPADTELSTRLREMNWVGRLRDALNEGRLLLYVQRIQALGKQALDIDRREILVRLREVDGSLVEPMAFIPAAERYNLMPLLDRYIFRATLQHVARLTPEERKRRIYAVNLSGTTLSDDSFLPFVKAQIEELSLDASHLCFEVTETAAIANLAMTAKMMNELNGLGFRFALDDFGSGMSSFGYLKILPVEFLKIDGRFVKDIVEDSVDSAMVEAITKVAHVMGLQTIAEYAENEAILRHLATLGVDFAQGFAVHRPEPIGTL